MYGSDGMVLQLVFIIHIKEVNNANKFHKNTLSFYKKDIQSQ